MLIISKKLVSKTSPSSTSEAFSNPLLAKGHQKNFNNKHIFLLFDFKMLRLN